MRYIAIALVLISLPLFINLLRQFPHRRAWALTAIGLMLFCGGSIRIDASIVGWPLWNGVSKGMDMSPIDALAIALIVTRGRRDSKLPFRGLFALYAIPLGLSILAATVPMATVFVWWHYGRLLLLFVALGGEIGRPDLRTGLFSGLSLGLVLQAGYVIQQKLSGVVQATGTMYHQNTLGMMTELAVMPLVAALLAGERSRLIKIGIVAGLIVVVGGGSRAALIMVGGGLVLLTLISLVRQATAAKLKVAGVGALALAIVTPLGLMTLKERFGSRSVITEETERAAFERAARAMAADHPFGVGANMYVPTANLKGYADNAGVAWNFANRSAPVHNAYLLARAETGWPGEIAYILLLVVPMGLGLRFAFSNRNGTPGEITLGASMALVVLVVHNNYEYVGVTLPVLSLASLNIALVAGVLSRHATNGLRKRGPRRSESDQDAVRSAESTQLARRT